MSKHRKAPNNLKTGIFKFKKSQKRSSLFVSYKHRDKVFPLIAAFVLLRGVGFIRFSSDDNTQAATPLKHKPPDMNTPIHKYITASGWPRTFNAEDGKDYIWHLPANQEVTEHIQINGGRNHIMIGGKIRMHQNVDDRTDAVPQHALRFDGWTGEVFVEGLFIDPGGGRVSSTSSSKTGAGMIFRDAIRVNSNASKSTFTMQNTMIDAVAGSEPYGHGNIIQSWAGPVKVQMYKVRGRTNYQGILFGPNDNYSQKPLERTPPPDAINPWTFEKVQIEGFTNNDYYASSKPSSGFDAWYKSDAVGVGVKMQMQCIECYAYSPTGWGDGADGNDDYFSEKVNYMDRLPSTPFVTAAEVGLNYISPGYGTGTAPSPTSTKSGDVDSNGTVNGLDLSKILSNYGKTVRQQQPLVMETWTGTGR